jgi:hypothetical protein
MSNFDAYLKKQLKNKEFRKEFIALEPQYNLIKQILKEENKKNH